MASRKNGQGFGTVCTYCFNVQLIFDFCLECDIDHVECSCKKRFSSFLDFKNHVDDHIKPVAEAIRGEIKLKQLSDIIRVFVCSSCKSVFKSQKTATIHLRSIHFGSKEYECSHCHRKYQTKLSLSRHLQIHSQQPTYICDLCQKSYFRLSHLRYHILSHMNLKSFKCDVCEKSFNDEYMLSRHLKQHATEKHFKCDQCGKLFTFNFTLKRHKLTHSRTNSFVCDICKKNYKWKVDLRRHILQHVQGKSFACSICKKAFVRKSYLLEHKLSHNAAKMHLCFCGKTFKFLSGLSKHRTSHKPVGKEQRKVVEVASPI